MHSQAGPDRFSVVSCDGLDIPISEENRDKFNVQVNHQTSPAELEQILAEGRANALVVRSSTKLPGALLKKYAEAIQGTLKMVVRAGVGIDSVDVEALKELGVSFHTTPDANRRYVAQRTRDAVNFCFLSKGSRTSEHLEMIGRHQVAQGEWRKSMWNDDKDTQRRLYPSTVAGRTVGVVGFGHIGAEVARQLKNDGARVLVYARDPKKVTEAGLQPVDSVEDLARRSHAVTVHVSDNPSSNNLIGQRFFEALPAGRQVSIVNMSRGTIVSPSLLLKALNEGKVGDTVLDVLPIEGQQLFWANDQHPQFELINGIVRPLMMHPKVFMTHHSGAQTVSALKANSAACGKLIEAEFCA